MSHFWRFFFVSLGGLALDMLLALALSKATNLPLFGAAAVSLLVVSVVLYFAHENWTFGRTEERFSLERMLGTVAAAVVALATRTLVLLGTGTVFGSGFALPQLAAAVGMSFLVNYLIVRRVIGSRSRAAR